MHISFKSIFEDFSHLKTYEKIEAWGGWSNIAYYRERHMSLWGCMGPLLQGPQKDNLSLSWEWDLLVHTNLFPFVYIFFKERKQKNAFASKFQSPFSLQYSTSSRASLPFTSIYIWSPLQELDRSISKQWEPKWEKPHSPHFLCLKPFSQRSFLWSSLKIQAPMTLVSMEINTLTK